MLQKGYVNTTQGQVHYRTEGDGEPLLLFHMSPLCSLEFSAMMPFLGRQYRVVAPDMLGHGESSDPPREYTFDEYAEATLQFMDAMGIKKAHLGGNHTGGAIALYLAVQHPERVDKLLISGECLTSRDRILAAIESLKKSRLSRDLPMDEEGRFLVEAWARYKPLAPNAPLPVRYRPFVIGLSARLRPYDVHMAVYLGMLEDDRLPKVKQPMLIYSGDRDLFFDKSVMDRAGKSLPTCRTAIIEGAGAMICFEKPEELSKVFLDFLGT